MASKHISIRLALICLVVILTCDRTSAKPFAPWIAFKKGLKIGFLKSLGMHEYNTGNSNRDFLGSASGNLNFTGRITPIRSSNQQSPGSYGSPYYHGAQLQLTSNARVSGSSQRVYSETGRATRRRTLSGNMTFNANVNPIRQHYIVPVSTQATYVAPPTTEEPFVYIPPVPTTEAPFVYVPPATTTPAPRVVASIVSADSSIAPPIANGFSAVEANIIRSGSGMAYGSGNIHINVANAGSGTGAVIHIGRGSATESHSNPIVVETDSDDGFSASYQPSTNDFVTPSDSYLPPGEDLVASIDSYSPPSDDFGTPSDSYLPPSDDFGTPSDSYLPPSDDFVVSSDSSSDDFDFGTFDTFETASDDDALAGSASDYADQTSTDTFTDFDGDTASVFVDTAHEPASNPENTLEIKFSASGSGNIETNNGINAAANANFQSSISTEGSNPTEVEDVDFTTTLDDYSGSNDDTDFDTTFDNADHSSTSSDYVELSDTVDMIDSDIDANNVKVETNGFVTGSTSDINFEPTVTATGPFSDSYDRYINTNVAVLRELSDIAKTHGSGRPFKIRLRTRHRVSQRPSAVVNPTVVINAQSVPTSNGGDVMNLLSGGVISGVSRAPLLYKYSDVIESPDAVSLDTISSKYQEIELSEKMMNAKRLQKTLKNNRQVSGARRQVGAANEEFARELQVSPSGSRHVNYQLRNVQPENQTRGKAIPSRNSPVNTIQQNALNIRNRNSPNDQRVRDEQKPTTTNNKRVSISQITRQQPSIGTKTHSPPKNKTVQSSTSQNNRSMIDFLARFAEAHRLSLIKERSGSGTKNSNPQNSNGHTIEIQSGRRSARHAPPTSRISRQAMKNRSRPTRGIPKRRRERPEDEPETVRDSTSPSRHGKSLSFHGRSRAPHMSSLDWKENSGIERIPLVGRFSYVIPSPSF